MLLQNKIALVTGASRGTGKAIAIKLALEGAKVIGVDYKEELANEVTAFLSEHNLSGEGMVMDVTSPDSVTRALEQINKKYGAPNILINNAGITRDNLMLRMSQEEWDQVIATNLTAIFRLCRLCIRDMVKARFGRIIINIASVVGYMGNAGQANYSASKAGVIAFSKSLAQEVASRNITVNCIVPGYIETDMTKKLSEEQREKLLALVPMKRVGQPEDIANSVIFLASDHSSYITGASIHVNGGMYMI